MLKCLLVCVIADYITALIYSYINNKISSKIGFRGILKKILMFIMVYLVGYISPILFKSNELYDVTLIFYTCNELFSIIENMDKSGVKLPKVLVRAIKSLEVEKNENNR